MERFQWYYSISNFLSPNGRSFERSGLFDILNKLSVEETSSVNKRTMMKICQRSEWMIGPFSWEEGLREIVPEENSVFQNSKQIYLHSKLVCNAFESPARISLANPSTEATISSCVFIAQAINRSIEQECENQCEQLQCGDNDGASE